MRLIRAELLKMRRRTATYVILAVALALTGFIYLVSGRALGGTSCLFSESCLIEFPAAYALAGQFAFVLGGLLAIVYAATIVGADWNWGVLRNVIARGESRSGYLLAKAAGIAIVIGIGMLIIFAFAILMTYLVAAINGFPVASPLRGRGLQDLFDNLGLGYLVLLERAAIGFAVAVVLRSQLAGAVVGIVLFVGEGIVTTVLTIFSVARSFGGGGFGNGGLQAIGPEWFQYLPISVGGQVLSSAPGGAASVGTGGVEQLFLKNAPLELSLPALLIYLLVALAVGIFALRRQEIV